MPLLFSRQSHKGKITTHEAEKEANPMVGSRVLMQEGLVGLDNFERLAKVKIFKLSK
jgi:hypothetical protein